MLIQTASLQFFGEGSLDLTPRTVDSSHDENNGGRHTPLSIYIFSPGLEVHFARFHQGYSHQKFRRYIQHRKQHDRQIRRHERCGRPVSFQKDLPSAELRSQSTTQKKHDSRILTRRVTSDEAITHHDAYGWSLDAYGKRFLSYPCASNPWWNRM